MGDGHVGFQNKNPMVYVSNTNVEFLEWIDDQLGVFSNGIELSQRASDNSGYDKNHDVYRVRTRSMPCFKDFAEWYDTGEKVYPEDLYLTPMLLKMWYCCDGTLRDRGAIQIGSKNEQERSEFIRGLFEEHGFSPTQTEWNWLFTQEESRELLQWMGDPPFGMEHKWGME